MHLEWHERELHRERGAVEPPVHPVKTGVPLPQREGDPFLRYVGRTAAIRLQFRCQIPGVMRQQVRHVLAAEHAQCRLIARNNLGWGHHRDGVGAFFEHRAVDGCVPTTPAPPGEKAHGLVLRIIAAVSDKLLG